MQMPQIRRELAWSVHWIPSDPLKPPLMRITNADQSSPGPVCTTLLFLIASPIAHHHGSQSPRMRQTTRVDLVAMLAVVSHSSFTKHTGRCKFYEQVTARPGRKEVLLRVQMASKRLYSKFPVTNWTPVLQATTTPSAVSLDTMASA